MAVLRSDTERVATVFVEGVNAYVRLVLAGRAPLPLEFRQLGYEPALWAPVDVARIRSNGLYYNLDQEAARALTLRDSRRGRGAASAPGASDPA